MVGKKRKEFLQRFQAKLDEYKKKGSPGCTHNEFLLSMLANMSEVKGSERNGMQLFLSPFGVSHRLKNSESLPLDRHDFDQRVKQAVIEAIENLIFVYSIRLKDLKSGVA